MDTLSDEKRRFKRIFHDAGTNLVTHNGISIPCKLLDISLHGCLIIGNKDTENYQTGDHLTFDIVLSEALCIEASAHIVFIGDKKHIGFQFDGIDIDSITALRRLVELNMGDPAMLERNLQALSTVIATDAS